MLQKKSRIYCPDCGESRSEEKTIKGYCAKHLAEHTPQEKDWKEELVEKLACIEHERWARWQAYLHGYCCVENNDGSLTIPAEKVRLWQRQIDTIYDKLSESEKESERIQVREYLPLIDSHTTTLLEQKAREIGEVKRKEPTVIELNKFDNPGALRGAVVGFNEGLSTAQAIVLGKQK